MEVELISGVESTEAVPCAEVFCYPRGRAGAGVRGGRLLAREGRAGLSDVDGGKVGDGVVQVGSLFLTGRTQARDPGVLWRLHFKEFNSF